MNTVIFVLAMRGAQDAIDNLWHHEIKVRLPRRATAQRGSRGTLCEARFIFRIACANHHLAGIDALERA